MLLKYLGTVLPANQFENKVCGIAWSPNNLKLAVATNDRYIHLFDENCVKKDRFSTKPLDAKFGKKSYVISGIVFSPDSTKIAVGQTDCIVYVYKIGEQWGEKKVICNKFKQSSIVTCLVWPTEGTIIVGLLDGRVRAAAVRSQKSHTLYAADTETIALAVNVRGTAFLSSHADGSIVKYLLSEDGNNEINGRIITHPTPAYCLAWPRNYILAAGCDCKVMFYDERGNLVKIFDYSRDHEDDKEISSCCCSPSGQSVAVGCWNRMRVFDLSPKRAVWEETGCQHLPNMYSITAMSWRKDGSRLIIGGLTGAVEQFETILKKTIVRGSHEVVYVGPSQVVVRPLTSNARSVIVKSNLGHEIEDVRVLGRLDNKIVVRTNSSLLIGDIESGRISEILWESKTGNEKFFFEYPGVCLIFSFGELTVIEYGENVPLGSVRTEFVNPHVVSVRINERQPVGGSDNKRLAYLLDSKTVRILDLVAGVTVAVFVYDVRVDWLELSETGHRLLSRDKKARLWLGDEQGNKILLLSHVSFVSWVPGSDVAVAQSGNTLVVWYNIDAPEVVSLISIKGDAVDILRENNSTFVAVEGATGKVLYILDEALIEFGTALHDNDFGRLVLFLEQLGDRPQAESMWENVARNAITSKQLLATGNYSRNTIVLKQLHVAARCYAALGDVACSRFLKELVSLAEKYAKETGTQPLTNPDCWAKIAILNGELKTAEAIYLEQNELQEALDMYKKYWRWEDALSLAESRGWSGLDDFRNRHLTWLLESGQTARAASVLEETQPKRAVKLYLDASRPGKAARVILSNNELLDDRAVVAEVVKALKAADSTELAGELLERTDEPMEAIKCYSKAGIFSKAIELARHKDPNSVVDLEREWGEYLTAAGHFDAAINHFIEAGHTTAALNAAINARQWNKALQILQVIEVDDSSVQQQCEKLAEHYSAMGDDSTAEELFIRANKVERAIESHIASKKFTRARELAMRHLPADEAKQVLSNYANTLRDLGDFRHAEELYIASGEYDAAIAMYRQADLRADMIRLVTQHRKELLDTTHDHLGKELLAAKKPSEAEAHFLAVNDWRSAVAGYKAHGMWEDAVRVARSAAGEEAAHQVALMWAQTLTPELAARQLKRLGYFEACLGLACDANLFQWALEVAKFGTSEERKKVHHKRAIALESSGQFDDAEREFTNAGRSMDAANMYMEHRRWSDAERIASSIGEDALNNVLVARAEEAVQMGDYALAESLLLRAHKPEIIVEQYKKAEMWVEALRVCREYIPAQETALQRELAQRGTTMQGTTFNPLEESQIWLETGDVRGALQMLVTVSENGPSGLIKAADILLHHADLATAMEYGPNLGLKLCNAGEYALAAQIFLRADQRNDAIDALISINDWPRARSIVREFAPDLEPYVHEKYEQSLSNSEYEYMSAKNNMLEKLIKQGDWEQIYDITRDNPKLLQEQLNKQVAELIKLRSYTPALMICEKFGTHMYTSNWSIFVKLAEGIFNSTEVFTNYDHLHILRTMLLQLHNSVTETQKKSLLKRFLEAAHFACVKLACEDSSLLDNLKMKCAVSLLRYTDFVLADRAYYEAGMAARLGGNANISEAFVFLNHFLDLEECIDDTSEGILDVDDIACTDFPREVPLNDFMGVEMDKREEVRNWILGVSVDQKVDQSLPVDDRGVYVGSLSCPTSPARIQACSLTGYPVRGAVIKFNAGDRVVDKADWTKFMNFAKQAPEGSNIKSTLDFIVEWFGDVSNSVI